MADVARSVGELLPDGHSGERGQLVDEMVRKELKIGNTFLCGNTFTILACAVLLKELNRATAFHIKRLMK